jgi:hypothetical protein
LLVANASLGESSHITSSSLLPFNEAPLSQIVLGLPAVSGNADVSARVPAAAGSFEDGIHGTKLKKRKRALTGVAGLEHSPTGGTQAAPEFESVADGVMGNTLVGNIVSDGGDVVMTVNNNPLYDETDVTAGPASQACRGK